MEEKNRMKEEIGAGGWRMAGPLSDLIAMMSDYIMFDKLSNRPPGLLLQLHSSSHSTIPPFQIS